MPKTLQIILGCCAVSLAGTAESGTVIWSGNGGANTNWVNGNNWIGLSSPAAGDDVKFFDAGSVVTSSNINNAVDGAFGGTIASLQYGNTNNYHAALISAGQTFNITGTNGLAVFMPVLDSSSGQAKSVLATITGMGGALNVSNAIANLVINQAVTNGFGGRATLDLSGLDTFTANLNRIGIGTVSLPNTLGMVGGVGNQRCLGTLYLAKTNLIRLNYAVSLATYLTANATNALEMSRNPNNNSGAISFLYLGQTNTFYVDSLGVGRDKASASSAGWLGFNPAYTNNNPVAYFRGTGGDTNRVTWWGIGDMNAASSAAQCSVGICDFSCGKVDALVNVMSLARDGSPPTYAGAPNQGTFAFTTGIVDINTLYVGNQSLGGIASGSNYNACIGVVNVNGSNATLVVNNSLVLGQTVTNSLTAQRTTGTLNINQGVVRANSISTGIFSTNNAINLSSGTLIVTNASTTNTIGSISQPITVLTMSNSTVWLGMNSNSVPRISVVALQTGGISNCIGLVSIPVYPSYPTQVVLIKYATLDSYNIGMANALASAPGAYLVNNATNRSVDLMLTSGSTPTVGGLVFLQQPSNTIAGSVISPAVKVAVTNSNGGAATNTPVFISLLSGTGTLNGSLTQVTDQNGVATFPDLNLTVTGPKILRAAAGGKITGSSNFNIIGAAPASLVFAVQPIDTVASNAITPFVSVQLMDAYGNKSLSNGFVVNMFLASGAGNMGGATSILTDTNGQAVFTNLSINLTGSKQLTAVASGLLNQSSSRFYILPNIPLPVIPGQTFYVTNYGAKADSITTNTTAIQNTINAAAQAGGGTVRLTAPGTYLSGPLNISNKINLQIDTNAMLQMLPYGSWPTNYSAFINSSRQHDIEISGEGIIDGQGAPWWAVFTANNNAYRPNDMINMYYCTNVLVKDITLQNAPMFHFNLNGPCQNVNISHITVSAPTSPNTDGTDFSANNILIQYCSYNDGDDDPVLKSIAYNATIADCVIGQRSGIAVGSGFAQGGVTNYNVVNCIVSNNTDAIYLKCDRDRGGLARGLSFANLTIANVSDRAFSIYSYYNSDFTNMPWGSTGTVTPASAALDPGQTVTATTPIWRDITFSNITATSSSRAGLIWGLPEMLISNVFFIGVTNLANGSFKVLNARAVKFIDSPVITPSGVINFELYNAELILSNSAPVSAPVTLNGFSTNGIGNTLSIYNAQAVVNNTNLFSPNPVITLGGGSLIISNSLNLGAGSQLNFFLGTNPSTLVVVSNLVLNGTINVNAGAGFTATNYTLFTYTGKLAGSPVLGATPTIHYYNYALETNTPGLVRLIVTAPAPPKYDSIRVIPGGGGAMTVSGSSGVTNSSFWVLASTNLTLPLAQWSSVATNQTDVNGHFLFTYVSGTNNGQMFYRIELP